MASPDTSQEILDKAGELPPPKALAPFLDWWQHIGTTIAEDPTGTLLNLLLGIAGSILATLFIACAVFLWRHFQPTFWNFVAWLGTLPGLRSLAIQAYQRNVRERYGRVTNVYLDQEETLDLRQVFVPLSLRSRATDGSAFPRPTRTILTDPVQRRLVILGAPGSGKSTFLKALASGVSRQQWVQFRDLVPIFVPLRAYPREPSPETLETWLVNTILPAHGLRNARARLESLLRTQRVLLLLDGLDEVSDDEQSQVLQHLAAFLERWDEARQCRVFLTCREQNFDLLHDAGLLRRQGFVEYRLRDLRDSDMAAMVHNRSEEFRQRGKSSERFLRAVRENSRITALHRSPLLLTLSMALYLHRLEDTVPHDLAAFYDETIDHLLRRRDLALLGSGRRINCFDARDKTALLHAFALRSMQEASKAGGDFEEFAIASLVEEATVMARNNLNITEKQAEGLVQEIHRNAGLISDVGNRTHYTFAHRSLHEFCAARQLVRLGEAGLRLLWPRAGSNAWRQTVLFYCSIDHPYAARLVDALLALSQRQDVNRSTPQKHLLLALLGHCAAVLATPRVPLRLQVAAALIQELEQSPDSALWPHMFGALIALGHDAPTEVYEAVDTALRRLMSLDDPQRLAQELSRLEKTTALSLLEFMASTAEVERQRAALLGLAEMEGLEKLPLLWQLLEVFHTRGERGATTAARQQILALMEQEGAVERLHSLPTRLTHAMDDEVVRQVYPFLPEAAAPNNFARLLALEAQSSEAMSRSDDWQAQARPWQAFLHATVSPKSPEQGRQWRDVPRARLRRVWRVRWQTLGRLWWGCGMAAGAVVSTILLLNTSDSATLLDAIIGIVVLFGLGGTFTALLWLCWRALARRGAWLLDYGIVPHWGRLWLEGISWRVAIYRLSPPLWRSFRYSLIRVLAFSGTTLLLPLALVLTYPSWRGHTGGVRSAVFAPDGGALLTASYDGTARLWDVATGEERQRFTGHTSGVLSAVFAPDGGALLTASRDGTARLWDVATGEERQRFTGHTSGVLSAVFAPDGGALLTASYDGTARLWDVATGKQLWATPTPFWHDSTWGWDDILTWLGLIMLFFFIPTTRLFDTGRFLYLRTPNPYLPLYDLPGIERWLPPGHLAETTQRSPMS